ncbi:MAG: immunoglobulin domain-containing protein [Sedimentisphaerales bacterium]|nr:immunoglobulin domain-containing protein [Sedimentisphaerales bacterium]MBN2844086.1 immunoglobulin domain-containing protein [Sedimentisphaerales bacterium]
MKKVVCVLLACLASTLFAGVGAYDSLSYPAGSLLNNGTAVTGFSGVWSSGGGDDSSYVLTDSLNVAGAESVLAADSGSLRIGSGGRIGRFVDTSVMGPFAGHINAQGNIGKVGESIYLSFQMRTDNANPFFAFELKRDDLGDNGAILYIGNDIGGTELQVCAYRNRSQDAGNIGRQLQWLGAGSTDPELFVVRIDYRSAGDNVTVYRNPSLEEEPNIPVHLLNAGSMAFDGMSMAAWVGPTVFFDEICIADTYEDVVRMYHKTNIAQSPSPSDRAAEVALDSGFSLSWTSGQGITPASYIVYFSDSLDEVIFNEPNALLGTTANTAYPVGLLATDSTYYWSVTELMADGKLLPGVVWQFDTVKTLPVIVNQPASVRVFAGENAELYFEATTNSEVYYQWYNSEGPLADGGRFSGVQNSTLVITGVHREDDDLYYCKATNSAGSINSANARVGVNRLVGKWSMDKPADGNINGVGIDLSEEDNDLGVKFTAPANYSWETGADGKVDGALIFDYKYALGTLKADGTMNAIPVGDEPYTMSIWIKGPLFSGNNAGLMGWGNYGNYNQCNALAMYTGNRSAVNNYWWDNDLTASRGYNLDDNQWHQVVATYDGDIKTIYIDGVYAGSNNPLPHNVQSSVNFYIGKANTTSATGEFFNGAIDEVAVYNYALTELDVAYSYYDMTGDKVCVERPAYDLDSDCQVSLADLAIIMADWLDCSLVPDCLSRN